MQESKVFIGGGLDSDTATEYVAATDYRDALNTRIITSDGNKDAYISSVTGNNLIPYTLPVGVNKGVGGEFFPEVMAAYIFIFNDQGRHRLVEVTYDEVVTTLFENLTDSDNADVLPLLAGDNYVKDLNLVDGKYLYFIDSNAKPSVINIERLKVGDYGVVKEEDFSIIKIPPTSPPTFSRPGFQGVEYITNSNKTVNNLYNKTFQFRYQYIYWDNEPSVKSPISVRPLPNPEEGDIFEIDKNNGIRVGFSFITSSIPDQRIKDIVLSFREDMGDWQYWKTVSMDYINSEVQGINPLNPPPPNFIDYKYLSTYVTYFYNDGVYPFEDVLENDLAFDWVPRSAGALEVVNGNVLTLWDLFEGYPKPVVPDGGVTITKSVYDLSIYQEDLFRVSSIQVLNSENTYTEYNVIFSGQAVDGNVINLQMIRKHVPPQEPDYWNYSHTITAGESSQQGVQALADSMNADVSPTSPYDATVTTSGSNVILHFYSWTSPGQDNPEYWQYLNYANVLSQSADIGGVERVLKKGSNYQLALSYSDKYGRLFPLITGQNYVVNTDVNSVNLTEQQAEEINWSINFIPPSGAAKYQWLLSFNNTHQNFLQIPANLIKEESGGGTWTWDVTSLLDYVTDNNGTIIGYEYTQGDIARMVSYKTSPQNQVSSYFNDFDNKSLLIRSFELVSDTSNKVIQYKLKTTSPSDILISEIPDGSNVLLELYTPTISSSQDKIFYEVGPSYNITNGLHSVTSGTIREGDSFVKFRNYDWVGADNLVLWTLESQHISDYKTSNFHNYGRPRIINDVPEGVVSKASGRYSDVYLKRNNTNMLNRFYAERFYESLNEEYGAVKHARIRDNILVIIQERKIAYIPVNRSILEDLEGQQNVSISDELLNPHSYSRGDNIGVGSRIMSLSSNKSQFYFIDPYKKLPAVAGLEGVRYIGGKFSTEMMSLIDNVKETVGYYDALNDEYVIRIGDVTYAYSEVHDKWVSRYSYLPEIGITANDKMFTVKLGVIYVHRKNSPKNTFYGVVTKPTIKIVINSNPAIIKTFQSISLQCSGLTTTTIDGIETSLGQVSDLLPEDFELYPLSPSMVIYDREGAYYANFLRDKNIDLINGDRLKGNWMTVNITPVANDWTVLRVGVDYQASLVTP